MKTLEDTQGNSNLNIRSKLLWLQNNFFKYGTGMVINIDVFKNAQYLILDNIVIINKPIEMHINYIYKLNHFLLQSFCEETFWIIHIYSH